MFTAYSTQGQLKPRLILAEGFWYGLIQAAAYLGRESVRINALKRCPRLAEAVNDCCACSVFNYIPDLHGRETRVAVAGKWVLFTFTNKSGKWGIEIHVKKEMCGVPQKKSNSNPSHMQRAWDCRAARCLRYLGKRKFSEFNFKSTLIKSATWPRTKLWTIYTSSSRLI